MTINRRSRLASRRGFLQAAGSGIALSALGNIRPSRAAAEKVTFQLDWIPFGRHAPYYAALDKGFYSQRGLDVAIAQGTGSVPGLRALATGQVNFLFGDIGSMIAVRSRDGVRAKALACMYQKTPNTIFFMKSSGISKPKDLEGRKLAYTPGDLVMFPAFALANGIDEKKITFLSADPNSKNTMFLTNNVDSMMTYIFTKPVLQKAAKSDAVDGFVFSDWGVDFYSNGLLAMEDYVKQKPEVTRNFVHATMQGLEYALAQPEESVSILKKHQPQLNEETAIKEVELLRELTTTKPGDRLGAMTPEKMQHTIDLTVKYLDLKNVVDLNQAFTNEFLM